MPEHHAALDARQMTKPVVSVIMANFEAGDKIVPALRSVLGQSMSDLEVIVSDDASKDHSLALVRAMMETDPRIQLVTAQSNGGPAQCRNRALDLARGQWVAVVDSDDIIHPERLERLLAFASQQNADIVADDLLLFHDDRSPPGLMLGGEVRTSFEVSPVQWILAGFDGSPALGYLKPMIRTDRLQQMRYDQALRIGEDYDFVLRLLLGGARMVVVPEPFYLYRRHSASISHRLSTQDLRAMIERQIALLNSRGPLAPAIADAFARRLAVLRAGLSYEDLVAAIKDRNALGAIHELIRNPRHFGRLWSSFIEGRQHRGRSNALAASPGTVVLGGDGAGGDAQSVPQYVPTHLVDWTAARPRGVWRDLARHAGGRCVALDEAGRYAAGFIPEVTMEDARQLVREPS